MEEKSGIAFNTAYAWRNGKLRPTIGNLVALAQSLGFEIVMRSKADPAVSYDVANLRPVMNALNRARLETGLTTKQFRAVTSVANNSFYAWLDRRRDPTLERFVSLVEPLGFELIMRRHQ